MSSQLGDFQLGAAQLGAVEESATETSPGSALLEFTLGEPSSFTHPFPGSAELEFTLGAPTVAKVASAPGSASLEFTLGEPSASGLVQPGSGGLEFTLGEPSTSGLVLPGSGSVEFTLGEPSISASTRLISAALVFDLGEPLVYPTNNAYTFLVGDVDASQYLDCSRSALTINRELNGRATASFGFVSKDGTYRPAVGADVRFMLGPDTVFAGTIQEYTEEVLGPSNAHIYSVSATDYNAIMDRRIVYKTYAGYSAKEILMDIVGTYLGEEGIDWIDGHGDPAVEFEEDIVFNGITVADAVSRICDLTNWDRFIDDNKGFHFFDPGSGWEAAPESLTQDDGKVFISSGKVRRYRGNYTNVQWVRSSIGLGGTFVEQATSVPGLIFKIAEYVPITAVASSVALSRGNPIPPLIKIEGASGDIPSLIPLNWVEGFEDTTYPDYTIDGVSYKGSDAPKWQAKIVSVPHFDSAGNRVNRRTAGQYIVLNEYDPDVAAAGAIESVTVESPTPEGNNQLVKSSNTSQIAARQAIEGGSGKWEHVEDIGDVENAEEAQALADAMLSRKDSIPIEFTFQTDTPGWKPGQLAPVELTRPLVPSGSYLVQRVTITEFENSLMASPPFLRSTVQLVDGSAQLTPVERARRERARERPNRNTANADMVFLLAKTINGRTNPGLEVGPNAVNNYQRVTQKGRIVEIHVAANEGPTGAAIKLDVLVQTGGSGTYDRIGPPTVYPGIAAGSTEGTLRLSEQFVRKVNVNDRIRIDVVQVGSTLPGKDIIVTLKILV